MSAVSEVLEGTYLQKVLQLFPEYEPSDFWSLICCGSDLENPYNGWAGVVTAPVFSNEEEPFELFFGEFTDSLAQYENVPRCRINYDMSRQQAFSEFRSYIQARTSNPVFISANASRWTLPIVTEAVIRDPAGPWNAQLICLRDLYSAVDKEMPLRHSSYIGDLFMCAPPLPKRFGLHVIARELGVSIPDASNKAAHRARITAASAYQCLTAQYPLQ